MGCRRSRRFNEAAGIHRRKLACLARSYAQRNGCFNEAAGIHRRKRLVAVGVVRHREASMRPPEFTGGNSATTITGSHEVAQLQ